jgi:hypothetical protein
MRQRIKHRRKSILLLQNIWKNGSRNEKDVDPKLVLDKGSRRVLENLTLRWR